MKEGFAIFYALHKWEYLLRDRTFTILTDHANLTKSKAESKGNKMIKRWFLCYQEYDIQGLEFLAGELNEVPDVFSRQCSDEREHEKQTFINNLISHP